MTTRRTTFSHFKLQGEWAELLFMARAAEHGLAIARPWGDSSPYDVAIEHNGSFLRVQVKSTQCKRRAGYKCHVDSNGVPYRLDQLDFIAAYIIPEKVWFIIPFEATQRTTGVPGTRGFRVLGWRPELFLTPRRPKSKYGKYEEAWHLLRNER